ncbi:MAG: hypothetical protein GDA65_08895 [Nitrospira sp. CR1.1]|nr:hypothetical protein [Nitrospira sp. CR1.1]
MFANDCPLLNGASKARTARLLRYHTLYRYYSWLGVTDASGTIVAATNARPPLGAPAINRAAFDAVRRSGTTRVEPVSTSV